MHILFLTDNFPPEGNAPASRTFEHARRWVEEGCYVTVITGAPNVPEGKVYGGYKNLWYQKEFMDGIEVRRVKTYITANEGFSRRTLDYLSYMVTGFVAGLFVRKVDVIVATSPQFFTACAGWMLSVFKWKPFVFELRDIWPASIQAVGAAKNRLLFSMLEGLELFLYRRAALVVSVTNSFKEELIGRGIPGDKIQVVVNGVDQEIYKPMPKDPGLLEKYDLEGKFVAGYIGTIGMAHSVETIVEAAALLQAQDDIVLLIVGGGAESESIRELILERELGNIRFLGRQDKKLVPAIWSLCDVSIVHLKDTPLFSKVIPSKIFECFAMGIPIILGLPEGEASEIIRNTDTGMKIKPESASDIAGAIVSLKKDNESRERFKNNALEAATHYSRDKKALDMLGALKKVNIK
ncbi:MAG: glycosyltransferase family 4 protein [Gammaproteobacteria bacterium]